MLDLETNQLTHQIIGTVYHVYNDLGFGYQEKYYYRSIKNGLLKLGMKVEEQLHTPLKHDDKIIGRYFLDFLINDLVVLEIKVANQVYPQHIRQVLGYLKAHKLHVGLITVIGKHGVIVKRVLN